MSNDSNGPKKHFGIPFSLGQIAGGATGFYLGVKSGEPIAQILDKALELDLSPEQLDLAGDFAGVAAGVLTGMAGVAMARKDPNHAFFFATRTVAGIGAAAVGLKIASDLIGMDKTVKDMDDRLARMEEKQTHVDSTTSTSEQPIASLDRSGAPQEHEVLSGDFHHANHIHPVDLSDGHEHTYTHPDVHTADLSPALHMV